MRTGRGHEEWDKVGGEAVRWWTRGKGWGWRGGKAVQGGVRKKEGCGGGEGRGGEVWDLTSGSGRSVNPGRFGRTETGPSSKAVFKSMGICPVWFASGAMGAVGGTGSCRRLACSQKTVGSIPECRLEAKTKF